MKLLSYCGKSPKIHESCYISEGVYIIGDVEMGAGSSAWFGTVIRGDVNFIRIGSEVSIQDGSVVHVTNTLYPTTVGDRVVIGHRVVLHGCSVGSNILIGMGSVVMDGARIGDNCIIAAGSLVTQKMEIPDYSVVMGWPAKIIRKADAAILGKVDEGIENYRRTIENYRRG